MLTFIRYLCAVVVGYLTPQLLEAAGVPLNAWAQNMIGASIGASHLSSAQYGLFVVGPIFAVFLVAFEACWQPSNPGWRKLIGRRSSRRVQNSHDTWLLDAVFFITHRRWVKEDEEALTTEEQTARAAKATSEIRELAGKGRLTIWGKMTAYEEHQAIPFDYWNDHQIDTLHLLGADHPEEICTERVTAAASWDRYDALKVNKAQIEGRWPPKTA